MTARWQLGAAVGSAAFSLLTAGILFAGDHPSAFDAPLAALNPQIAAAAARAQFALSYADTSKAAEACSDVRYRQLADTSVMIEPMLGDALAAAVLSRRCAGQSAFLSAARATEPLNRRDLTLQGLQLDEQLRLRRPDAVMATMRRMIVIYPELSDQLVPLLARVAEDDAALSKVVELVKRQSDWKRSFLSYAAATFPPDRVLQVRREYGGSDPELASIDQDVVRTLAARGSLDAAWDYYRIAAPDEARARASSPLAAGTNYQPFGWSLSDSRQLQVRFSGNPGELLLASLRLRAGGTLAGQAYPAEAGRYVAAIDFTADPGVTVTVQTRCLEPLTDEDWLTLRNGQTFAPSTLGGGRCRFAAMKIDAVNDDSDTRHDVVIRKVALSKAG